jgi:hypothetical protein
MVLYIDGPPYGSALLPGQARQTPALVAIIARRANRLTGDVVGSGG